MFECLKNKRKQRQGERSLKGKYSDDDLGWAKFALDSEFTIDKGYKVGEYNTEEGTGIITKPDGTQVTYVWDDGKQTFKP
jgi:hypothetical protein